MMRPKISIIIPIYNREKYLNECLDSVLNQTLRELEIICIDDGSTDSSTEILRRYAKTDERIIVLRQEHSNAGQARNYGIDVATGKCIYFLDSDDVISENNALEILYNLCEQENLDIAIFNYAYLDDKSGNVHAGNWVKRDRIPTEIHSAEDVQYSLFQLFGPMAWNKLYNRDFVNENRCRFQSIKRNNDMFFVYRSLALAKRMKYVDSVFLNYRINVAQSLQNTRNEDSCATIFLGVFRELYDVLKKYELETKYKRTFLNAYISTVMDELEKNKKFVNYKAIIEKVKVERDIYFECDKTSYIEGYWENLRRTEEFFNILNGNIDEYLFTKWRQEQQRNDVYTLPTTMIETSKKIVVYGAGTCGKAYVGQILASSKWELVAIMDRRWECINWGCVPIYAPDYIKELEFDKVLIAIENITIKKEVQNCLISLGVEARKIVI